MSTSILATDELLKQDEVFSLRETFSNAVSGIKNWFNNTFRPKNEFARVTQTPDAPALNNGVELSAVEDNVVSWEQIEAENNQNTPVLNTPIEDPNGVIVTAVPERPEITGTPIITDTITTGHESDVLLSFDPTYTYNPVTANMQAMLSDIDPEFAAILNSNGGIDGKFGQMTQKAVALYQKENGLEGDGVVTLETLNHIQAAHDDLPTPAAPENSGAFASNSLDVNSLVDFIYQYEASGDHNLAWGETPFQGEYNLTEMTINEVRALQAELKASGSPSTALGAPQIIGDTMDYLIKKMDLTGDELFDEQMQRDMTITLMERRGLSEYQAGNPNMPLDKFMGKLAQEWASLPKDETGLSHYDGDGLNVAHASYSDLKGILEGMQPTQDIASSTLIASADTIEKTGTTVIAGTPTLNPMG